MISSAPLIKIFETGEYALHVRQAADLIAGGGIVILPTETVYGAAVLLTSANALSRLQRLPPEAAGKAFTLHLANPSDAGKYVGPISAMGRRMIRKLWPGPVGITFKVSEARQREVAEQLGIRPVDLYEGECITLRCPDSKVTRDVISAVGGPVVMRRATGVGEPEVPAPPAADDWADKVDMVIDAGSPRYQKPSTIVSVDGERYEIVRSGVYDQRIIDRLLKTTILFVCSGNTCRSPMAEVIAKQIVAKRLNIPEAELEKAGVKIESAGSYAMPGARATGAAVVAMKQVGADLGRHRSRPLSVEMIHQADVIYVMAKSHEEAVVGLVPSASTKLKRLDEAGDVEDPIGGDVDVYVELAGELRKLIEKRLEGMPLP